MSEIEHAQALQAPDARRYLVQIIVSQHKRLDIGIVPNRFRHLTEVMLPEIEVRGRLRHGGHFSVSMR